MKKFYLIFLLLLAQNLFSQNSSKKIDSLLRVAETANDSVRLRALNKMGFYYIFNSPSEAKKILKPAIKEAQEKQYYFSEAELTNTYGIYFDVSGKSDSAKYYFEKALRISNNKNIVVIKSMVTNNLGMFNWNKGEYQTALDYFFQALELNDRSINNVRDGIYLNNIGLIYQEMGQYDKALTYHKKALKIREYHQITNEIPASLNNIAINLKEKKQYKEALKYSKLAVAKAKEVKSMQIYYEALNTMSNIYMLTNKYKEALPILKKINIERDSLNIERTANLSTISNIIESYNKLNQPIKTLPYIEEGFDFIKEFPDLKNNMVTFYKNASETFFRLQNTTKGSSYLSKSLQLKDSIFSLKNAERMASLETKFKVAENEKKLAETRANLAESELEVEQKNIMIFGSLGFALVLGLLGYFIYKQQNLKNQQLKKENELKVALVEIETQNKLQEQRLRISRDLHDNIGSQLTFVISSLDNLKYKLKEGETTDKLSKISEFTTNTIYELRDTIWAMNKNDITFEDLQTRISNFIDQAKIASDKTKFSFGINSDINQDYIFSSLQGMNLYRIIQEAINNASKYAKASRISVQISESDHSFQVEIKDNGIGFNKENTEMGNGISNIQKRAKDLNGKMKLTSEIDKGTCISIKFPV
jgi:signal transduction histidine kinase/Tfp pilus assembly protein PilF